MTQSSITDNVLIIDDDESLTKNIEAYLKSEGVNVLTADNGAGGLAAAKSQKPAVILLDILMPTLDGREVLKRLKRDDDTKHIPVFIFSNLMDDLEKQQIMRDGAADYFVKAEIEPEYLLAVIRKYIKV